MNKEYILEKLAQEFVGDYIGNGPHPILGYRGYRNVKNQQKYNHSAYLKAHAEYMRKTGKPIPLSEFGRMVEAGDVPNPMKPGFLQRHGKTALLLGGGALVGIAGLSMLKDKAEQTAPTSPELTQVYNTPGGQMPYGQ